MMVNQQISELEISNVAGKSVLTTSKVYKPLKVFPLKRQDACQLVFSNYGGGFVEGDQILLQVDCHPQTITVFSSQANTRVYKSETESQTRQEIAGKIGEEAFVVYLGDPLVLQKDSIFEQVFHWELGKSGVLLLVDWFEAGRIMNNERFAFRTFLSEFKVVKDGIPLVWDRFKIDPISSDVNSPGSFLHHGSYINVFLVGHESAPRVQVLETQLRFLSRKYLQEEKPLKLSEIEMIGAGTKINEHVFMLRCSAKSNDVIQPLVKELAAFLEEENLLGFNPLARKF